MWREEDHTIIDASPLAGREGASEEPIGMGRVQVSGEIASDERKPRERAPVAVPGEDEFRRPGVAVAPLAMVGGEDAFILAWGRANAAVRSRGRQLVVSSVVNVVLALAVGYLAWRNERKETLVFVRDSLGNVVQADANGFMHAGDRRTEAEIKGFMRGWILDGFSWTPLDVEDRLRAHLRLVDAKAQPAVKAALRLGERRADVEQGISGRVYSDPASGKEPQIVITRTKPLEVLVSFDRYQVEKDGTRRDRGRLFVRAHLKEVPRSPGNPHGLLVVDEELSEQM